MPWRGPEEPGEFPTLGYLLADWIEEYCVIPDGNHQGEPYILTDEMLAFLIWHYRLAVTGDSFDPDKPSSAFTYRRSQLVRPQKWGKGPLSSAVICAEACGPVLFDGWDAYGEPVGRPWATPWIQVVALSQDQTDNVWRSLKPMIDLGPLAEEIPDTGLGRINLRGGGFIEPVTSSANSRLGQRISFAVHDETHSWVQTNGGHKLATTQRRNLAGMGGRSIETTNAWDPAEDSVAQRTYEGKTVDVFRDVKKAPPFDSKKPADLRRTLKFAYGDSWWVDLDRIEAEHTEIAEFDRNQADRFFCNAIGKATNAAFDIVRWAELADPDHTVPEKAKIVIGFDGARFHDATAMVATELETGFQWALGIWERPWEAQEWEVDADDVNDRLAEAFDLWRPVFVYADPPFWESTVDAWASRYTGKRVKAWWTNRARPMAYALKGYSTAMTAGDVSHNGDPHFSAHIGNARRRLINLRDENDVQLWVMSKETKHSRLKIDAAMAGTLSWEARGDAIALGHLRKANRTVIF